MSDLLDSQTEPEGGGDITAPEDASDETARFDDPYWDDAFCAWWDPALRTCCG